MSFWGISGPSVAWPGFDCGVIMLQWKSHFLRIWPPTFEHHFIHVRAERSNERCRDEMVKMSRWGGGDQIKRARQVDWEQKRQERASTRQNGYLPVVEKSGRKANIRTTEWAAVWFNFTLFISSPSPVTANRAILFQVCCNPTPAKHSHPMH